MDLGWMSSQFGWCMEKYPTYVVAGRNHVNLQHVSFPRQAGEDTQTCLKRSPKITTYSPVPSRWNKNGMSNPEYQQNTLLTDHETTDNCGSKLLAHPFV